MKTVFIILFLFASLCFSQNVSLAGAGTNVFANDTITTSEVLTSNPLYVGLGGGYTSIIFEFTVSAIGDSAETLDVYYKANGGVSFDSLGVDSLFIFQIDSAYRGDPFLFDLTAEAWYMDHDVGELIIVAPATLDSMKVKCIAKGFRK